MHFVDSLDTHASTKHMSPVLNGNSVKWCFNSYAIEIHYRITFNLYTGLPHVLQIEKYNKLSSHSVKLQCKFQSQNLSTGLKLHCEQVPLVCYIPGNHAASSSTSMKKSQPLLYHYGYCKRIGLRLRILVFCLSLLRQYRSLWKHTTKLKFSFPLFPPTLCS